MRSNKPYTNVTFTRRVDHLAGRHRGPRALPGPAVCQACGAVFIKRHWVAAGTPRAQVIARTRPLALATCDACQMVSEGLGRGELRMSGEFLAGHREEIEHLLRNTAARALADNPLARIAKWTPRGRRSLTVVTTTEALAQRLGREMKKTFHGSVRYDFSHENKYARVEWTRE